MEYKKYLPWQESQWQKLKAAFDLDRMPHAILLSGVSGLGKNWFARFIATYILCSDKKGDEPCLNCHSCRLLNADSHPDFKYIEPESPGKSILVDQIRNITSFFTMSSQLSGYKAAIISPADKMNRNASNSLLKTLEEPSSRSVIILVTDNPSSLPATIRSRCQVIDFKIPEKQSAIEWLKKEYPENGEDSIELSLRLASGRPFIAEEYFNEEYTQNRKENFNLFCQIVSKRASPIQVAEKWSKADIHQVAKWIASWVSDMILLKQAGAEARISNIDLIDQLKQISSGMELKKAYKFLDKVNEVPRLVDRQINSQLLIEDLLLSLT